MTEQAKHAPFDCVVEEQEYAVVVAVTGTLDIATQAAFAEAVRDALRRKAATVVIDLARVTFLASPGLAVLVEAQEDAMRLHKNLHVAVGNKIVERSIEITGLGQILSLTPDVRTALGG